MVVIDASAALHQVLELALRTGLPCYDAAYLWTARTDNLRLVTLDAALAKAAIG